MNKSIKEVSKQYMLKYLQFIDLFDPLATFNIFHKSKSVYNYDLLNL